MDMRRMFAVILLWMMALVGCGGVEEPTNPPPPDEEVVFADKDRTGQWVCREGFELEAGAKADQLDPPECFEVEDEPDPTPDAGVPEDATPPHPADAGDEEDCLVLDGPCTQRNENTGEEMVVCYWHPIEGTCTSECMLRNNPVYSAENAEFTRTYAEVCRLTPSVPER